MVLRSLTDVPVNAEAHASTKVLPAVITDPQKPAAAAPVGAEPSKPEKLMIEVEDFDLQQVHDSLQERKQSVKKAPFQSGSYTATEQLRLHKFRQDKTKSKAPFQSQKYDIKTCETSRRNAITGSIAEQIERDFYISRLAENKSRPKEAFQSQNYELTEGLVLQAEKAATTKASFQSQKYDPTAVPQRKQALTGAQAEEIAVELREQADLMSPVKRDPKDGKGKRRTCLFSPPRVKISEIVKHPGNEEDVATGPDLEEYTRE